MTNKQKYLKAFQNQIQKYRKCKLEHMYYFKKGNCYLCNAIKSRVIGQCIPCPLTIIDECGCTKFKSYREASKTYFNFCKKLKPTLADIQNVKLVFSKRANALQKILKIIEKWPESRFTKKGFKYHLFPKTW